MGTTTTGAGFGGGGGEAGGGGGGVVGGGVVGGGGGGGGGGAATVKCASASALTGQFKISRHSTQPMARGLLVYEPTGRVTSTVQLTELCGSRTQMTGHPEQLAGQCETSGSLRTICLIGQSTVSESTYVSDTCASYELCDDDEPAGGAGIVACTDKVRSPAKPRSVPPPSASAAGAGTTTTVNAANNAASIAAER